MSPSSRRVLDRTEHQGERGTKFVADIGEEGGLGAIDLRERIGATALGVGSLGIGNGCRDLSRDQTEESPVSLIERPSRAGCDNEKSGQPLTARALERQQAGMLHQVRPGTGGNFDPAFRQTRNELRCLAREKRFDGPRAARGIESGWQRVLRQSAGVRDSASGMRVLIQQVDRGEWRAERVLLEHFAGATAALFDARRADSLRREIAQNAQPPLADHSLGDFGDDTEHASDPALIVVDRAVGEGVVGLLGEAAAREIEEECLVPGCPAVLEHLSDAGTDVGPDLLPDLVRSGAERPFPLDT